ncbi:MAG: uroporphyrinogen decarboxylase family protein [Armatimonadota bacterium]
MGMTGREILLQAFQNQTTPRPAWIPFVGCHGGALIGVPADEYLQSSQLIARGLLRADELYRPDGLPITFDLQMEAEILGCELRWASDGPPNVVSHPLAQGAELSDLPEFSTDAGRFPLTMQALRSVKAEIGERVALYGLICGPFTLGLHLLGNDIFLEMFDSEQQVRELMGFCAEVGRRSADAYIDNGADVIAVVDPMVSQISPQHFQQFVTEPANELFDHIHRRGSLGSLFCCGDATRNLEVMAQTRCDNISVDENVDLAYLRDIARAHHTSFGGNLQLTVVLLLGTEQRAKQAALECIDIGDSEGYILAPGCDLPYDTPPENVAAAGLMAVDEYEREVARQTVVEAEEDTFEDIELPDYEAGERVILDVITLDSSTCAPCQYMVDAATRAAGRIGEGVEVHEHKITRREGLGMFCRLDAGHVPTICIDGRPTFVSIIPDQETLVSAIRERMEEKRGS